jgi:ATP-dependent 26S proteasome regulatory subunit
MKVEKAPLESYADIRGLDAQIQEIKEAVLYGEPGTGKTLLAKVSFLSAGQIAQDSGILLFSVVIAANASGAI